MPADTETRIVEMRFDSRDFDPKIAKSKKTLEDFKKELDFDATSKGLREFTSNMNAINFSGLAANIERLTDKFTGLGDAGEWVMSRIRSGIESAMLKTEEFLKSFTTAQISVGQGKYDALNKAAQALIASGEYTEEQAYSIFQRVMDYTDQTSANFETMVDKLQEFTATGRGLQESEHALEGIFNLTAKFGKGVGEASAAMGVFSKAMGQGYLSLNNWQSLNTTAKIAGKEFRQELLETAVAMGDLVKQGDKYYIAQKYRTQSTAKQTKKNNKNAKKAAQTQTETLDKYVVTADNLESTLSKKWASKDTMMALFNKYYLEELDPDKAAETIKILEEAAASSGVTYQQLAKRMDDAKIPIEGLNKRLIEAAVKTGDLTEKNGKYYTSSKKFGKQIEVTAKNVGEIFGTNVISKGTIGEILSDYKFAETAYKSAQRALTFADAMNAIKESISSGWMQSFRHIFGDVTEAMETFTNLCNRVIESIYGLQEARNKILEVWAANGGRADLVSIFLGDYGKSVETGAYGLLDLFDDVGSVIADGFWNMVKLFTNATDEGNWDKEGFKEAWLGLKLSEITKQIKDFIGSVKNFFTEEIKIGDTTTTRLEMIKNVVNGIAGILVIAANIVGGVLYFIDGLRQQLQPTIDTIQNFFSELGKILYDTADDTQKNGGIILFFADLLESLKPLTATINSFSEKLSSLLLTFIKWGIESGFFAKVFEKLKTVFVKFNTILTRVVGPMITFLGDLFDIFKELFESGFDPKAVAQVGAKIKAALDKMFSSMLGVESLDKAGEQLRDHFKAIMDSMFDNAPDWVKKVIVAVRDLFGLWDREDQGNKDSVFTKIREFFQNGFGSLGDFLNQLFSSFQGFSVFDLVKTGFGFKSAYNFLKTVSGWFKGTNLYNIIKAFLGVAIIWDLWKLIRNVKNIGANLKWAVGEIAESFKSGFKVRYDDYGEYLMKMAEGIAIFVGCVAILGSMKTGNLIQGIVALGLVMGAVVLFNKLLKKDFDNDSLKDQLGFASKLIALGFAITSMTAAVALLALALVPLGKLSVGGWLQSMGGLLIILGAITAFAYGIKKLKLTTVQLTGLITVSLAVSILVLSIIPFALMNWESWARSIAGLVGVLAILTAFAYGLKALKLSSAELKGIIALSAGVAIIVLGIVPFALMSWEAFARSLAGLVGTLSVLTLFAFGLKKLDLKSAQLKGLIALSAGVAIIVLGIVPFALMTWGAFARSLIGLVATLGALTLFAFGLKKLSLTNSSLKGLTVLSLGVAILVLSVIPFALMDWGAWARSLIGLVAVLGSLTLFALGLSKLNLNTTKLSGLITLSVAIGIISLALLTFSSMDWPGFARAVLGLVAILGSLYLFSRFISKVSIDSKSLAGLIAISSAFSILCRALRVISEMNWEEWKKAMLGMLAVLGMLLGFSLLIGNANTKAIYASVVAMLSLALTLVVLSFALNEIKNINEKIIDSFAKGFLLIVLAMSAAILVLQAVPITGGLKAILLIAAGIIAIAAILSIAIPLLLDSIGDSLAEFGAKLQLLASVMDKFSTSMNAVDEAGINKAETIVTKLKKLIAGLSGTSSLSETVNDFTTALFDLGTSLENFNTHVKDLPDPEGSSAFKMVDKVVGLADTLTGFHIGNFANEIYGLGLGLYAFEYLGSNMGDAEQSKPLQLLTQLAGCATDLQTLSTIGLDSLKGQLAGLGGAMMLYAEGAKEVTGVEGDQTSNVENAMAILQAITKAFTEEGGFTLPEIPTEAELGSFGADLAALAGALVKFTEASNGLGEGTDKAIELLSFLSQLKTKLVADDVKVANVFGDAGISHDVLEQFGLDIISLGTSLQNFTECTKDIDEGKIKTATDALSFFEQLKAKLTAQDAIVSVISFFTDNKISKSQLSQFGKDIEALGSALKSFATSVSWNEQTEGSFQSALDALGFMADLETKLPKVGGVVALITGQKKTLTSLAAEIVLLGEAINSFNSSIVDENGESKLNGEAMKSALDILDEIVTLMTRLQTEMEPVGGFLSFFTGSKYDTGNLKKDIGNFKGVIAELVDINKLFNGNDEKNPIPTTESMNSAITVLDVIIGFISSLKDKMPESRPLLEAFTGQPYDTSKLASDITNFGTVIRELSKTSGVLNGTEEGSVKIDKAQFDTAIESIDLVLGFITQLGEKMPKDNTFLDNIFTGEKYSTTKLVSDMTNFRSVIDELNKISKLLRGDDKVHPIPTEDEINVAIAGITPITDFVKKLGEDMPESSWLDVFTGRTYDLTNLKTDITNFGLVCDELKVVADKLSGKGAKAIVIDETAMTNASTSVGAVLSFVTKLGTDMPLVGGFVQTAQAWYSGHTFNLKDLQDELKNFGDCAKELVSISTTLTGENGSSPLVDETQINAATSVIDQVVAFSQSLAEKAPRVGGMSQFFTNMWEGGKYSFENLKTDLTNLGQGLGAFSNGVGTDFNADNVIAAIDVATGITEVLGNLSQMAGGEFSEVDRNVGALTKFLTAMTEGYDGWISGEQENLPPMIKGITDLAKCVSDAIDMAGGVKIDNIRIFEQMALGLKYLSQVDPSFNFEPVGTNIVLGIKNGIEKTQNEVTEAARALAIATYKAAMQALDAHSPSKLFMDVGDFITAGMAIGIDDGSGDVQNAIKDMSGDTFKTATNVLAIISQMLSEEINANPTITPVLDLTDLSNGITMMNGMLDGGRMSIDTRNAAILAASNIPHSTTAETNQNGTDLSGVYSRMAELGDKITEMADQITKMKIVLDTGVIAGAVTDQVDANIGAKVFYAGRGN